MSYSSCFRCHQMVTMYEKYCSNCEKTHNQDESFWKGYKTRTEEEKQKEIKMDQLPFEKLDPPKGKILKYTGNGSSHLVDDPNYLTESGMFKKHRNEMKHLQPKKIKRKKRRK